MFENVCLITMAVVCENLSDLENAHASGTNFDGSILEFVCLRLNAKPCRIYMRPGSDLIKLQQVCALHLSSAENEIPYEIVNFIDPDSHVVEVCFILGVYS